VNLTTGSSNSSTTGSQAYSIPNGTVGFTIGVPSPYVAISNATGHISVAGASVTIDVTFAREEAIVFQETGLPGGTPWQVAIGGSRSSGSGTSNTLDELPGSYHYTASAVYGGYQAVSGPVSVGNASVIVPVTFVPTVYQVEFLAEGLPSGTEWWANLSDGENVSTSSTNVIFLLPNGTYHYTAQTTSLRWLTVSGNTTIAGGGEAIVVDFALATYTVTFDAMNLPARQLFWVNLTGGGGWHGVGPIVGTEPSGGYSYAASAGIGWYPISGTFNLTRSAATIDLNFTEAFRTVTFTAMGTPLTGPWSVNWSGAPATNSSTDQIALSLQRGSAGSYVAHGPSDQEPLRARGSVTASATNQSVTIDFPPVLAVSAFSASPSAVSVGASTQLVVTATGGAPPLNYSYGAEGAAGCGTSHGSSVMCTPSAPGQFTVSVNVSDGAGSYVTDSLTLVVTMGSGVAPSGGSGPWLYIGLAAVLIVGAVAGAIWLTRSRRGRAAEPEPPTDREVSETQPEGPAPPGDAEGSPGD